MAHPVQSQIGSGFTHYDDFASAGAYNFNAQVIYATIQYRF